MKTRIVSTLSLTLLLSASHMMQAMHQSKRKNKAYASATQNLIAEGPATYLDQLKDQVPSIIKDISKLNDTLVHLKTQKEATDQQIQKLTVASSKSYAQTGRVPGVLHNAANQLQPLDTLHTRTTSLIAENEAQLTTRQADLARVSREIHVEAMKPSLAQITSEIALTLNHQPESFTYKYTTFAKTLALIPHINHNAYKECPTVVRHANTWNPWIVDILKGKKLNHVDASKALIATSKNADTVYKEHAKMNELYKGYHAKHLAMLAQVKHTSPTELRIIIQPMLFKNLSKKAYQDSFTGISKAAEQYANQIALYNDLVLGLRTYANQIALYNDLVLELSTSGVEEIPAFVPATQQDFVLAFTASSTSDAAPVTVAASTEPAAQQPQHDEDDMVKVDPASSSSTSTLPPTTSSGWGLSLNPLSWLSGSAKK